MGILAPSTDQQVGDVRIDADTLSVALLNGRTICPAGVASPVARCYIGTARAGSQPARVTASTGPTSMRT